MYKHSKILVKEATILLHTTMLAFVWLTVKVSNRRVTNKKKNHSTTFDIFKELTESKLKKLLNK